MSSFKKKKGPFLRSVDYEKGKNRMIQINPT